MSLRSIISFFSNQSSSTKDESWVNSQFRTASEFKVRHLILLMLLFLGLSIEMSCIALMVMGAEGTFAKVLLLFSCISGGGALLILIGFLGGAWRKIRPKRTM